MPVSGSSSKVSANENTISQDSVENYEESGSQFLADTDHLSFVEEDVIKVQEVEEQEVIEVIDEKIVEVEVLQEEFAGIEATQDEVDEEVVEINTSQEEIIILEETILTSSMEIGDFVDSNLADEVVLEVPILTGTEDSVREENDEDITSNKVELVSLPPIAKSDNYNINQSQFQRLNILENDTNIDGEVKITIESQAKNGFVELSNDGYVTYSPNEFFVGKDEFVYKVTNQNGESSIASTSLNVQCEVNCTATFKLSWDESLSPDVIGYNVYLGRSSDELDTVFELGSVSEFEFLAENRGVYYFAVAAINSKGMESELTQSIYGVF